VPGSFFEIQNREVVLAKSVILLNIGSDDDEAVVAKAGDEIAVPVHALAVEVGGGFVEEEDGGIGTDGEEEFEALFHAGRKVADSLMVGFGKGEQVEEVGGGEVLLKRLEFLMKPDGFEEGEFFDEFDVWGAKTNEPIDVVGVNAVGLVLEGEGAFGGGEVSGKNFEEGGFSGAVGA